MGTVGSLLATILAQGVGTFAFPCPVGVAGYLWPPMSPSTLLNPLPSWPAVPSLPGTEMGLTAVCLLVLGDHSTPSILPGAGLYGLSCSSSRARLGHQSFPALLPILGDEPEVLAGSLLGKGTKFGFN